MAGEALKGSAALIAKLKKNATMEDVKRIVKVNTAEMQKKAKLNAPVDTGWLKDSIVLVLADEGLTGIVSATANYAPYLEWGTRWLKGYFYMKNAFTEQKIQFLKDIQRLTK